MCVCVSFTDVLLQLPNCVRARIYVCVTYAAITQLHAHARIRKHKVHRRFTHVAASCACSNACTLRPRQPIVPLAVNRV